jgi:hypothetical protein
MKLSPKGGSFYMASKGQKFRRYTEEFKQRVLEEYFSGESGPSALARKYSMSYHTIDTWIDKARYPDKYPGMGLKKGRKKDSDIDWKERYEILKKYQTFLKAQRGRK